MTNLSITKPSFSISDIDKIDARFHRYLQNWKITEIYKGELVTIPNYIIFNYFEYTDTPNEKEKQVSIWCGWDHKDNQGNINGLEDAEVIINLRLENDTIEKDLDMVNIEILKSGGAEMKVYFEDQFMTDFWSEGFITIGNTQYKVRYPNGYQTRVSSS